MTKMTGPLEQFVDQENLAIGFVIKVTHNDGKVDMSSVIPNKEGYADHITGTLAAAMTRSVLYPIWNEETRKLSYVGCNNIASVEIVFVRQ